MINYKSQFVKIYEIAVCLITNSDLSKNKFKSVLWYDGIKSKQHQICPAQLAFKI